MVGIFTSRMAHLTLLPARLAFERGGHDFAKFTKGTQDARVQERGIRAKISLSRCSSPQHLQRPTPSHLSANATSLPCLGDENMASGRPSFRQLDKATERWDLFDPARPEGAEFHVKA